MDEIAEAIGQLRAGLEAIARRLDALQLERRAQHTEGIARITDVQAQIHEVKHTQNNESVKFARIEQQVVAHQDSDRRDHEHVIAELRAHQIFTETGIARLESEIMRNREAAVAREADIKSRLDDLFAWRNRVYGAIAVVVLALTVFGREIWEGATNIVHWITK